jgi:hypothetical protein
VAGEPRLKHIAQANGRLIDTERKYQRLSIKYFRKALEIGKVKKQEIPLIVYLTAEMYRRLDEGARAKLWFKAVRELPNAPLALVKWSKEQYGLIRQMPQAYPGDTALLSIVLNAANTEDTGAVKEKLAKLETRLQIIKTRIFLFVSQVERYPDQLVDLVRLGYIKHKSELLCPVTGSPFMYAKPEFGNQKAVMLRLSQPLPIAYGIRMISVKANGEVNKAYHGQ